MAQAKTTNSEKATGAATYKKEQLVASKRYANRRDIIMALLEDGKAYTLNEVDGLIEKYKKGKGKREGAGRRHLADPKQGPARLLCQFLQCAQGVRYPL